MHKSMSRRRRRRTGNSFGGKYLEQNIMGLTAIYENVIIKPIILHNKKRKADGLKMMPFFPQ